MRAWSPWARLAVPALGTILAGCAAPSLPPWPAEPWSPAPVEGWDAGDGTGLPAQEPGSPAGRRKSLQDPDAFLWRASAGSWFPSMRGDGWNRGKSADGVDAIGTGGGVHLGVRHPFARRRPAPGPEAESPPLPGPAAWAPYYGADLETFGGRADSGGDSGSLGALDLLLVLGTAHFPPGEKRPAFLAEMLLGFRKATMDIEGGDLRSIDAEASFSRGEAVIGVNLEVPLHERVSIFGRFDGGFGGGPTSDEHSTVHAFAGLRMGLGDHLSLEAGWRYLRVEETLKEKRVRCAFFFIPICQTDYYKVQEASLQASGPWLGLVYDF